MYAIVFSYSTLTVTQEAKATNSGFLETLLQNIPAQIVYVLGIVYGISLVLSKISDFWKKHNINKADVEISKLKVKEAKENLERSEIETDLKRGNINK